MLNRSEFILNKIKQYSKTIRPDSIGYILKKSVDLYDIPDSLRKDKVVYDEKIKTYVNEFNSYFVIDKKLKIGRIDLAQKRLISTEVEFDFDSSTKTEIYIACYYDLTNIEDDLAATSTKETIFKEYRKLFNENIPVEYSIISKDNGLYNITLNTKRLFNLDKPIKYIFSKSSELEDKTYLSMRESKLFQRKDIFDTLVNYKVVDEIIWQCQRTDKLEGTYLYVDSELINIYSLKAFYNLDVKFNASFYNILKLKEDNIISKIKNTILTTSLDEDFSNDIYFRVFIGKTKELYLNISIPETLFKDFDKLQEQFINSSFTNYIKFKNITDFKEKLNTFRVNNSYYKTKIEKDKNKIINLNLVNIEDKITNVYQQFNAFVNLNGLKESQIVIFADEGPCSNEEDLLCVPGETTLYKTKVIVGNTEIDSIDFSKLNNDISLYCLSQLPIISFVDIKRTSYRDYYKNYVYSKVLFETSTDFVKKTFLNQKEMQNSSAFSYDFDSRIITGQAVSSQITTIKDNLRREEELQNDPSLYLSESPKQTIAQKLATLNSLEQLYDQVVARFYLQDIVDEAKKCISAKTGISETSLNKISVGTLIQEAGFVFDTIDNFIVLSNLIPDDAKSEMLMSFFQCMPFFNKPLEQVTSTPLRDTWIEYKKRVLTILGDDAYTPEEKEQAKLKIYDCAVTTIKQYAFMPAVQAAQTYLIKNYPIFQPLGNELGPIASNLYDAVSGDVREQIKDNPDSSFRNDSNYPASNSTTSLFIDSSIAIATFIMLGGLKKFILALLKGAKCRDGKLQKEKLEPPEFLADNDLLYLFKQYLEEIFDLFTTNEICDLFYGDGQENLEAAWLVLNKDEYMPLKTSDLTYKNQKILIGGLSSPSILKNFIRNSNVTLELGMKEKCSTEDPFDPNNENCLDTSEEYWDNRKTELLLTGYSDAEAEKIIADEQKELQQALNDINTFKFEFKEEEFISPEVSKFLRDSLLTQEQNSVTYVKSDMKELSTSYKPTGDFNKLINIYLNLNIKDMQLDSKEYLDNKEVIDKYNVLYSSDFPVFKKPNVFSDTNKSFDKVFVDSMNDLGVNYFLNYDSINSFIFNNLYSYNKDQINKFLKEDSQKWFETNKTNANNLFITQIILKLLSKTSIKDLQFESYDNIKELKQLLGITNV